MQAQAIVFQTISERVDIRVRRGMTIQRISR
jgi:hypothetical protein